ncbi:putative pentatricopeptide [Medicago truncatula]|uniref:Putative pentatricopeptide n=1 Tax=Medicago truncatula TaxID=3880 RepID=A0A396GZ31_MEDTR|nr:putative pentatricopeptide [Medicago truncatula]
MKDYYEEMEQSGIHFSKEVFVALIHAYAAYDEFEKAKQIVLDPRIQVKWLIEIKSMLVSSLASHGKLSEALVLLEEIKKAGQTLNPKANLCLMRSLLLLTELSGEDWVQGCKIVIQFSVENKNLSSTIEMFKQLMDYFKHGENKSNSVFDEVYYPILVYGSTHLQFGLDLLDLIKKELGLVPPSLCLHSLLCCCVKSRDLNNAHLVWREFAGDGRDGYESFSCYLWASNLYTISPLSYNIFPLSYNIFLLIMILLYGCRMYCALSALGDHKSADIIFKKLQRALFKK